MQQCVANIRCADNPTFPRQNDNVSKLAIESESERIQLALSLMQRGVVHREPGAGGRHVYDPVHLSEPPSHMCDHFLSVSRYFEVDCDP